MAFSHVLFDLDNTLLDYDAARKVSLKETMLQCFGVYEDGWLDIYLKSSILHWRRYEAGEIDIQTLKHDRFADFLSVVGLSENPMVVNESYMAILKSKSILVSGAVELLRKIQDLKIQMHIISNNFAEIQRPRLADAAMDHFFSTLIFADEVQTTKPNIDYFQRTFEIIGFPPKNEVIVVGDSIINDVAGAQNYGVKACWFNRNHEKNESKHKPDFEIHELSQLNEVLTSSNG